MSTNISGGGCTCLPSRELLSAILEQIPDSLPTIPSIRSYRRAVLTDLFSFSGKCETPVNHTLERETDYCAGFAGQVNHGCQPAWMLLSVSLCLCLCLFLFLSLYSIPIILEYR